MWKICVAAAFLGASIVAHAQGGVQPPVQWELQVMRDGQQVDAFSGSTTVGQARTDTHHHELTHEVGCKERPAGSIDLSRPLTVSPTHPTTNEVTIPIHPHQTP